MLDDHYRKELLWEGRTVSESLRYFERGIAKEMAEIIEAAARRVHGEK